MPESPYFNSRIEQVAEVQHFLRPLLENALRNQVYTEAGRQMTGYGTAYERWQAGYGITFFDMTTMIKLGSTIEDCLKHYYSERKGFGNAADQRSHLKALRFPPTVFQRLMAGDPQGVVSLYDRELGYDLATTRNFSKVQEAMEHRHLYAHGMGVLDDKYIANMMKITKVDLAKDARVIADGYPIQDIYWFAPLNELGTLIEATKQFLRDLP